MFIKTVHPSINSYTHVIYFVTPRALHDSSLAF